MRWRDARRSSNVKDYRGGGGTLGIGAGRLGIGGVAVVLIFGLLFGASPTEILSLLAGGTGAPQAPSAQNASNRDFVSAILGDTEDVWGALFQAAGTRYDQPRLTLFARRVQTACGGASSASGPFYCPADHTVYLDTSFFEQMQAQLGGGGDFAQAYVIAHEVGHHVQTLLGVSQQVADARQRGEQAEGDNGLSVRQELQADCFAGLWAYHAQQRHQWLEPGDVEEALATASAIGDDRLQRQQKGEVVPDAFTHGTAAQRVAWFKTGFAGGDIRRCDTFAAARL
jgi:predicted metalloprotease